MLLSDRASEDRNRGDLSGAPEGDLPTRGSPHPDGLPFACSGPARGRFRLPTASYAVDRAVDTPSSMREGTGWWAVSMYHCVSPRYCLFATRGNHCCTVRVRVPTTTTKAEEGKPFFSIRDTTPRTCFGDRPGGKKRLRFHCQGWRWSGLGPDGGGMLDRYFCAAVCLHFGAVAVAVVLLSSSSTARHSLPAVSWLCQGGLKAFKLSTVKTNAEGGSFCAAKIW